MKNLHKFIQEQFDIDPTMEDENFIIEGLIIKNRTIRLTDKHNKGVDFRLINNPIYDKIDGIDVISIFKRTFLKDYDTNKNLDGNPFIYALKEKHGWKFDISAEDIRKYCRRFLEICNKIEDTYDTIIMVPSKSKVNERFMTAIYNKVNATSKITKYFYKVPIDEIMINYESIQHDFPNDYQEKIDKIREGFRKMDSEFEAKYIDKTLLKYIKYFSNTNPEDYRNDIDNKKILILDDIVSSGTSISQCINNINDTFNPQSITVITLLSKL